MQNKRSEDKKKTKENGRNKFINVSNHTDSNWMKLKISEHSLDVRHCAIPWG